MCCCVGNQTLYDVSTYIVAPPPPCVQCHLAALYLLVEASQMSIATAVAQEQGVLWVLPQVYVSGVD